MNNKNSIKYEYNMRLFVFLLCYLAMQLHQCSAVEANKIAPSAHLHKYTPVLSGTWHLRSELRIAKAKMTVKKKIPWKLYKQQRKSRNQKDAAEDGSPQESLLKYQRSGAFGINSRARPDNSGAVCRRRGLFFTRRVPSPPRS